MTFETLISLSSPCHEYCIKNLPFYPPTHLCIYSSDSTPCVSFLVCGQDPYYWCSHNSYDANALDPLYLNETGRVRL